MHVAWSQVQEAGCWVLRELATTITSNVQLPLGSGKKWFWSAPTNHVGFLLGLISMRFIQFTPKYEFPLCVWVRG